MCGRKSTCDVTLGARIVPFPLHACLVAAEAGALLGLMWGTGGLPLSPLGPKGKCSGAQCENCKLRRAL